MTLVNINTFRIILTEKLQNDQFYVINKLQNVIHFIKHQLVINFIRHRLSIAGWKYSATINDSLQVRKAKT